MDKPFRLTYISCHQENTFGFNSFEEADQYSKPYRNKQTIFYRIESRSLLYLTS